MRIFTLLLVALLACAPPGADSPDAGRGEGPAAVRIVTWNVHDLFDEIDRTASPGDEDTVPSGREVEDKLGRVGRVLARVDADLIVLQEVENEGLLRRLAEEHLGPGYRTFLREGYDPRGIDLGVISRLPFDVGPSHLEERAADGRRLWSRDPIELRVALGARDVVVLGAHLASRLDPAQEPRRHDQAASLRDRAAALRASPGAPIVLVVGDLNDVPGSPALAPLLDAGGLVDLGRTLPVDDAWTWSGGGLRERIDYALVDHPDRPCVTWVGVAGGADVGAASDHRPVVVELWAGSAGASAGAEISASP